MIFATFTQSVKLLFTKGRRSVQTESYWNTETKINLVLFVEKLMVSVALPHKDLPYYKDFLEENKKWRTFGSYEELSWIKIDRTRNTPVCMEKVNY